MSTQKIIVSVIVLFLQAFQTQAQEDLLQQLNNEVPKKKELTLSTFKSTRIINSHTVECLGKGAFDFRIAHRFGNLNSGFTNWYGLDGPATLKLSFEYSFDGRFMFGIGRSSLGKLYDLTLKYRVLRQTTDNSMPVSITALYVANMTLQPDLQKSITGFDRYANFANRLSNVAQLIIGRKFGKRLSLQVAPTLVHINLVDASNDKNDLYAVASGGRYKFSRSMAITYDYVYRINNNSADFKKYYNSLSIGIDIETGGHVFQMFVTNSTGINEAQFIPYTSTSWKNGGVRLGFNVSRVFSFKRSKK
jgi:hypothetical protein